jgi:predicted alpha/beta-fold hydrolase
MDYAAPRWLPGGNLQTIWAALYARRFDGPAPVYRRERWTAPDGDFVDVDFVDAPASVARPPLLVLFHGLEGSSRSHYAEAFATFAASRGMAFAVPHFRGCSGELNLAPRAYHSGDFEEIGWILARMREQHVRRGGGPVLAAGVSLGGNALMRWASEAGDTAAQVVSAVASVCAPLDLAAGGDAIGRGFNRLVYTRMFLATMKPKALAKLAQFPGCSTATACWPRATSTPSTTCSPRRCTAFATPRTTGRGARPSRTWTASACRRWW